MRFKLARRSREEAHPQLAAEREAERRRARGRRRLRPGRILSAPPRALARGVTAGGRGMAGAVLGALGDVLGIAREMLAWPLRILMGGAKLAGQAVLAIWRKAILPMLRLVYGASAWGLRVGEREVTPARALTVVALAATVTLGASQFNDYRAVEVGAPQYAGVENIAPPPQVDQQSPRAAHGVSVFAIAVASLFVTAFAVARNWRLARLLLFLGAAVVLITLIGDRPAGLDTGQAGLDYEGAKAVLLGAFWAQLFSGVTLMIVGPLLAIHLRGARDARRARVRSARPITAEGLGGSGGGAGMEEPAT